MRPGCKKLDKMGLQDVRCIYKVHAYTFLQVKTAFCTFSYKNVKSGIWTFLGCTGLDKARLVRVRKDQVLKV